MKILGLDLGIGSVGWALIEVDSDSKPEKLLGLGSRIINLTPDEKSGFANGKGESLCSQRTFMRTSRKCLDRYQMRRKSLQTELSKLGMFDFAEISTPLNPLETWQLRANAATACCKLSLAEIGRVLLHINQKRGYRHAKDDDNDSSQREYVAKINERYAEIKELGMTVGQYFFEELKKSEQTTSKGGHVFNYRIKEKVLPRQAYKDEVEKILSVQSEFYPDILTDKTKQKLFDIIFYQRPLKSCKRLVSTCEFEALNFKNKKGEDVKTGPKVAPRTSPIAQITRIYEAVNNIILTNKSNKVKKVDTAPSLFDLDDCNAKDARLLRREYILNAEERNRVVEYLCRGEKLTETALLKLLGLKKSDGFKWEGAPKNGMPGNTTYLALKEALEGIPDADSSLLRFNLEIETGASKNEITREPLPILKMTSPKNGVNPEPEYINEPLYKLWHTVYSSTSLEELSLAMEHIFGITDPEVIERLYKIDFVKAGYTNRSAKFMRKILPLLMQGMKYSDACEAIGVNHSNSLTTEENEARELCDLLPNLKKGDLRQPIIEKILNQMINIVNSLKEQYGEIDEIRVELARQLKQSKDQRAKATSDIAKLERKNAEIAKILSECGIRASRRNIQKYRLWEETGHTCIYCGHALGINEYFEGGDGEIEHIIPRSIFFDDSFSNKVCSCTKCNRTKGDHTAYDFMQAKGDLEFNKYLDKVNKLFSDKKIFKTKKDRLTTPKENIPTDFLERDMRQTQYISRKAIEILKSTCRNVYASSGSVTDFLRHTWGYDEILHNLNIDRYAKADLVEEVTFQHKDQTHSELRIKDWSKRLDHRHHAIDALVVALTRQGYIQRLNNLNASRPLLFAELDRPKQEYDKKLNLLQQWAKERPHFSVKMVSEAVDNVSVSIKSGKKLTTPGTRYITKKGQRFKVQEGLQVPRGSLHEATIYGKIKIVDNDVSILDTLSNPDVIVNRNIRSAVKERLAQFDGDIANTKKSLKKEPIKVLLNGVETEVRKVGVYKEVFATRKPISALTKASLSKIVDERIKTAVKQRFDECGGDEKKFKQSVEENPIVVDHNSNRPVKSVRIWVSDKMVGVRKNDSGNTISFAMPGSNHHVAFYEIDDRVQTIVLSFWEAVKRKKIGIPPIIKDPDEAWTILEGLPDSEEIQEIALSMPPLGSKFLGSMKMGDMFIMGLSEDALNDAFRDKDYKTLSNHLYRVQKISENDYNFRLHTWTTVDAKKATEDTKMGAYLRIASYKGLKMQNMVPVNVTELGEIIRKHD